MPSNTDLQIRSVQESDVPLVLEFIRKLAEYGDISSEATVTEADLRAALFGARPVAEAILAYVRDEPAGFAVYSFTFSSFRGQPGIYVEDLFVEHQFRGRGVGKALLLTLARLGRERGCGRLEWSVLNWNEQAMEFYQDLGAVPMDEWTTFRLSGDALDRLASSGESHAHDELSPVKKVAQRVAPLRERRHA
ncbi:MAG: N-acetyltransferase [Acidobacteria bacterium]|nr:MAG: N-acetyltransferase [Acidobacteriota bacterium]